MAVLSVTEPPANCSVPLSDSGPFRIVSAPVTRRAPKPVVDVALTVLPALTVSAGALVPVTGPREMELEPADVEMVVAALRAVLAHCTVPVAICRAEPPAKVHAPVEVKELAPDTVNVTPVSDSEATFTALDTARVLAGLSATLRATEPVMLAQDAVCALSDSDDEPDMAPVVMPVAAVTAVAPLTLTAPVDTVEPELSTVAPLAVTPAQEMAPVPEVMMPAPNAPNVHAPVAVNEFAPVMVIAGPLRLRVDTATDPATVNAADAAVVTDRESVPVTPVAAKFVPVTVRVLPPEMAPKDTTPLAAVMVAGCWLLHDAHATPPGAVMVLAATADVHAPDAVTLCAAADSVMEPVLSVTVATLRLPVLMVHAPTTVRSLTTPDVTDAADSVKPFRDSGLPPAPDTAPRVTVAEAPEACTTALPLTTRPPHEIVPVPGVKIEPPLAAMVHAPVDWKVLAPDTESTALLRESVASDTPPVTVTCCDDAKANDRPTEPVAPDMVAPVPDTASVDVPDTAPSATVLLAAENVVAAATDVEPHAMVPEPALVRPLAPAAVMVHAPVDWKLPAVSDTVELPSVSAVTATPLATVRVRALELSASDIAPAPAMLAAVDAALNTSDSDAAVPVTAPRVSAVPATVVAAATATAPVDTVEVCEMTFVTAFAVTPTHANAPLLQI